MINKILPAFFVLLISFGSCKVIEKNKTLNKKTEIIKISTSKGDMYIWLYDKTPLHKANFLKLAKEGFFNGTTFHRVMNQFMIQGGDPFSKDSTKSDQIGNGGPGYTIPAEFHKELYHKKGVLSAARQPDNINKERVSSGSQFYIVQGKKRNNNEFLYYTSNIRRATKDFKFEFSDSAKTDYMKIGGTPHLDMQYTVFGEVFSGLEVVDSIAIVPVNTQLNHRPLEDIRMEVSVVKISLKDLKKKYNFEPKY